MLRLLGLLCGSGESVGDEKIGCLSGRKGVVLNDGKVVVIEEDGVLW
jgi:hypothetical protein